MSRVAWRRPTSPLPARCPPVSNCLPVSYPRDSGHAETGEEQVTIRLRAPLCPSPRSIATACPSAVRGAGRTRWWLCRLRQRLGDSLGANDVLLGGAVDELGDELGDRRAGEEPVGVVPAEGRQLLGGHVRAELALKVIEPVGDLSFELLQTGPGGHVRLLSPAVDGAGPGRAGETREPRASIGVDPCAFGWFAIALHR